MRRPSAVDVAVWHRASLGEGPAWLAARRELIWVDIDHGRLHRYSPGTAAYSSIALNSAASSAAPRSAGGLVVTVREGFAALEGERALVIAAIELEDPRIRMNDGACDRAGRYWAGTMCEYPGGADGGLYRLDAELRITRVLSGVAISNGPAWSPDDKSMYYVDSATGSVDVFDFDLDTGAIAARRPLIEVPPELGKPDGIAVDDEGCVWVALWGGAAVHRYTPAGRLEARLELPVSRVTSCCFGGEHLDTLFVTTAARSAPPTEPLAGALFACHPGVTGAPALPFAS